MVERAFMVSGLHMTAFDYFVNDISIVSVGVIVTLNECMCRVW